MTDAQIRIRLQSGASRDELLEAALVDG